MGYMTNFSLSVSKYSEELEKKFDTFSDGDFSDLLNGMTYEMRWCSHEGDMKQISNEFPDILFTLNGRGEEDEDIWVKYFKNGKMQTCFATIIFDEFDEFKLE